MNTPNLDVLSDITFIFDSDNWTCAISVRGGPEYKLTHMGKTNKEG
ncbi:35204_t:CDS:1, partial [Racocetra persica]